MAPIVDSLSHLANPLATPEQLETSASQLDGVPKDLEDSIRFETARLLQAAGILLRLPQEIIASAIVLLQRFWVGPDGGSLLEHDAQLSAAASLYLAAKPTSHATTPRSILTVFNALTKTTTPFSKLASLPEPPNNTDQHLPEQVYQAQLPQLYALELLILRTLAFETHVALPYSLVIHYLQTLDLFSPATSSSDEKPGTRVAKRAIAHLNSALLSPQLLYLTHQPPALACAAIYLAAREEGVGLPEGGEGEGGWWGVFDVEREEIGFLVVGFLSLGGFVREEARVWGNGERRVPLDVEGVRKEVERRMRAEV